jgi:hypothetical protein
LTEADGAAVTLTVTASASAGKKEARLERINDGSTTDGTGVFVRSLSKPSEPREDDPDWPY